MQISSVGGFTGSGSGNVTLFSDGKAFVTRPVKRGVPVRPCEGNLDAAELWTLNDAIKHTKPAGWKVPGLNVAAPDAFGYTMSLQTKRGGDKQTYDIAWYDYTVGKLPVDAGRLIRAVFNSMSKVTKNCP